MIELFIYGIISFLVLMWVFNWLCDRSSNKPITPEEIDQMIERGRKRDDY